MGNHLICTTTTSNQGYDSRLIYKKGSRGVKLEDLNDDVLRTILSKLPPKEAAKTSVLSSNWRYIWTSCAKLQFNGIEMFGGNKTQPRRSTQRFIDNVNTILQKCHGKVVEELEIKVDINSKLVDHLNNWIGFAVSSQTKSLALNLLPQVFPRPDGYYMFPFEVFDSKSISRIQQIQLSFVSFKPSPHIGGFCGLKKLDLNELRVTRKDMEDMLSSCNNLKWLSIIRCHLNDELIVDCPLTRLQYLRMEWCTITKIKFHAVKLATFIYTGDFVPIFLNHSSELKYGKVWFDKAFLRPALTALLNGLPNVQNLNFCIISQPPETLFCWDNPCKFAQLRHLQLLADIAFQHTDKILNLVCSLGSPFH